MKLTNTDAQVFVGGQIKVQSRNLVFCGEIREISITTSGGETLLRVRLTWKALGQGRPANPHRWINVNSGLAFGLALANIHVVGIGKGRFSLRNTITNELTFLYPPSAPSLDPNDVVGLRRFRKGASPPRLSPGLHNRSQAWGDFRTVLLL